MLEALITDAHTLTQVLFYVPCTTCSTPVSGRTKHKKYCEDCRAVAKLFKDRKAADVQRRKHGIPQVRGAIFQCSRCEGDFTATSKSRARFCKSCAPSAALDRARKASFKKDDGTRKRIGRVEECQHCFASFVVCTGGAAHSYCSDCKVLSKTNKLPHRAAKNREYSRARYRSHPKFALNDFMRNGVLKAIGRKKGGNSWVDFVDYTVDDLIRHLERQFTKGMTWENRGLNGWHVDHMRPLSQFTYESTDDPQFKDAWSLANLRPMWGDENIRKKDQRIFLI